MNFLKMTRLDYAATKSQLRVYPIVLLIISAYFIWGHRSPLDTLFFTMTWYGALITITVFQVEEKNSLRRLYGTLALKIKDIVLGRYLFFIATYLVSVLLVVGLYVLALQFLDLAPFDLAEVFPLFCLSFSLFSLMVGTIVPGLIRFGLAKGRSFIFLPFALLASGSILLNKLSEGQKLVAFLVSNRIEAGQVAFALGLGILAISSRVSIWLYRI